MRYHRTRRAPWPVTFYLDDGRQITVHEPQRTTDGHLQCRLQVAGGDRAGEYAAQLGYLPSAGAVIGATIRWWRETMGEAVRIGCRSQDD